MERGVITPAQEIFSNGEQVRTGGPMPAEKLRYYALYWDKVALTDATNNVISFAVELSEEQLLLESAGILRREVVETNVIGAHRMSEYVGVHHKALAEKATELSRLNPGQWVIHPSGDQLVVPNGLSTELITADFELARSLPVPKANVPLDKLLDFKIQRKDELDALRAGMDELYLQISQSGDIPRSKVTQIQRLENAIDDLDRVAQQSWGERLLASRKVSIDLNQGPMLNGVAAGVAMSALYTPVAGVIVGVATTIASSFKFELSITKQLSCACGKQLDLSYLSSAKKAGI